MNTTLPKHIEQEFDKKFNCPILEDMYPKTNPNPMNDELKAWFAQTLETEIEKAVEAERERVLYELRYAYDKIERPEMSRIAYASEETANFPRLIIDTRKKLGESGVVFGRRFAVSHAAVSDWERGKSEAPYAVISFCLSHNKEEG